MDKKTLIGLFVVGVILFGFTFYSSKQNEKKQEQVLKERREQFVKDSIDRVMNPAKYAVEAVNEEIAQAAAIDFEKAKEEERLSSEAQKVAVLGESLNEALKGEDSTYVLENELMKIYFSSRGGQVANIELKNYKRYEGLGGDPLMMYRDGSASFDMEFFIRRTYNYAQINTQEYNFTTEGPTSVLVDDKGNCQRIVFRLPVDEETGASLEYVYTVSPNDYMVDFKVNFVGMKEYTNSLSNFRFNWGAITNQNEKGFKNENMYTTIAYRYPNANSVEQLGASENTKSDKVTTKVNWLSFKQQYFSSIFIAKENFNDAEFKFDTYLPESGLVKRFSANFLVPYSMNQNEYEFSFYFGPNEYKTLKQYDLKLEKVIPLGGKLLSWFSAGVVINVMGWLSKYIESFGLIILLLTIMIKLLILPLTYKSYMSTAKMRVLKPEIDEIAARYPDKEDAMKKQQANMALYKKAGVSPMGGCLPMLIQTPILIAMFRFFPAAIELRGEKFLWAEDLSAYDSIIDFGVKIPLLGDHLSLFTLLMVVAMYFYSKMNYAQTAASGANQMPGMKFMMIYLMPIMMFFWFNSYASGLTYYYLLSQLLTMAIMWSFRYFTDEDKLRAKLAANAAKSEAKPKKKSKFQARYEEMVRQQQQAQRQQGGGGSGRGNTSKPQSTKNQPPKKR